MANTMQFDLVSPERALASQEATAVQIPGITGDLTAMPNHAPFLTTLRPGVLEVHNGSASEAFVVTGGFAEISETSVSVLAEQAVPKADASAEMLAQLTADAEALLEAAGDENRAAAAQRVNDLKVLAAQL
ncbi:F-type H+-transporting ATPase subunit epsilon [Rubricella aquisinus]|uniref:ATP synthase epsilon chain n=1 Tax=Rubricella aquisinus TaxID=2028108 RepID=A0A840WV49_9RHOB|nr:F0F1 ATP synthase subunit epsilon [Rubricella aquisinus]MBB5514104.1 F-type H+-transporting ATPase subunit epsilon [Rubricella aquisinus]